jgi:hypothetical protein
MYELKVELNRLGPKQFESDKITVTTKVSKDEDLNDVVNSIKAKILGEHCIAVKEVVVEVKEVASEVVAVKENVAVKKEKAAPKAKVVVKQKDTPYDRTLDTHKKLLASFLDVAFPSWKTGDNLPKAAKASMALVGSSFLNSEGEILEEFKNSFLAFLK